jgi:hypothetical protein
MEHATPEHSALDKYRLGQIDKLAKELGAKYALRLTDGTVIGELPTAPQKPAKKKHQRKHGSVKWQEEYDYIGLVAALPPGEYADIALKPLPDHDPERLRSCLSAAATLHWGAGTYATKVLEMEDGQAVRIYHLEVQ